MNSPQPLLEHVEKFLEVAQFPFTLGDFQDEKFLDDLLQCLGPKNSLIPELLKVVPKEYIFVFLYVFAGQKLVIPDTRMLFNTARDLNIYYKLKSNNTQANIVELAAIHKVTSQTVTYAYSRIKLLLEN